MLQSSKLMLYLDALLARQGHLGRTLIKAVVSSAGIKLAYAAIGFVNTVLLAKLLSPAGYGIYAYAMALVTFLSIPSQFGLPALATRELAVSNAHKDWGRMRGFIRWAHSVLGLFAAVLVLAAIVALLIWGDGLSPVKLQTIALGLVLVPLLSLGALRGGMLRGLRKVVVGQLPDRIVKPSIVLIVLALCWHYGRDLANPVSVMALQIAAATIAFSFGLFVFLRSRPPQLHDAVPQYRSSAWLKSTIPLGMSAGLQLINGQTDILVLGMFRPDADVGIYRVAVQMAAMVIFALQVVNVIQGPHIAHMYATGDKQRMQKMVTKGSLAILAVTVPIVLVVVVLGPHIIDFAFGREYEASYVPLLILCAGQLVNASMGSVQSLLNMTGHERDTTISVLIGAVVNVVLNFVLVPIWGMNGAAVATSVTLIVWNVIMWRLVYLRTGIEASGLLEVFQRRRRNR